MFLSPVSLSFFLPLSSVLLELIFCAPSSASTSIVILHFPAHPLPVPPSHPPSIFPAPSFSLQAAREKESSQAQLKALSQQTEVARRELAEILGRLAQREEELHRKDVELSESRQRHLSLEQEIREVWGRAPRNGKYICFKTQGTQQCLSNS